MKRAHAFLLSATLMAMASMAETSVMYAIVDTRQDACYDLAKATLCPSEGEAFFGQDAQFEGLKPEYQDQGNGTVLDASTGLMWMQARGPMLSWDEAMAGAKACRVGGHDDWRMPSIKELYSLIDFRGCLGNTADDSKPYLDETVFGFAFGDTASGVRLIDAQDWTATEDLAPVMSHARAVFGVNFIDGRIKAYPKTDRRQGQAKRLYARYVRGNPFYGKNDFESQTNGAIIDKATGLEWEQQDSGHGMDWPAALAWAAQRNAANHLGHSDWRLPNAKELQSLADYGRGPDIDQSPAISPLFNCTTISNEAGEKDWPWYWSSTTHRDNGGAVYVCFGRALGYFKDLRTGIAAWVDVHGAGAQRSDPKTGSASAWPQGHGPQGDAIRILNYVRLVRGGTAQLVSGSPIPGSMAPRRLSREKQGNPDTPSQPTASRHPPQAAIDACQGHAPGDAVTFTTPRGKSVNGICQEAEGVLFAVPKNQ
jgi:hypothetical protein